jgi:DNA repair protein RecO (recombination protein O)
MPAFTDEAFVLSTRRHGESSVIATLFSHDHGRVAGRVQGGAGKAARGTLQPGNRVEARWSARLEEQLGHLTCDLVAAHAAVLLDDVGRLAALSAACAVTEAAIPEREPMPGLFADWEALIEGLTSADWAAAYVRWELALLAELGFGLDLTRCAATGATADLCCVSPKSGCAVSAAAAAPYRDKLLPLPGFLLPGSTLPGFPLTIAAASPAEIADGLRLTGYFLSRHALADRHHGQLPAARIRLEQRYTFSS